MYEIDLFKKIMRKGKEKTPSFPFKKRPNGVITVQIRRLVRFGVRFVPCPARNFPSPVFIARTLMIILLHGAPSAIVLNMGCVRLTAKN